MLLQDGVTARAEASPEATALVFENRRTSYRQLEQQSNRLARLLLESGCSPEDRIAILMPKMPAAIVAMLGTLKAGSSYVPMNPGDPPYRLARTLEIADCRAVLVAGNVGDRLRSALAAAAPATRPLIGRLDEEPVDDADLASQFGLRDLDAVADSPVPGSRDPDRLAQILFTSGSTGAPKGVMVRHRNVVQFIRWACGYFGLSPGDRVSQHSPLRFDVSTFDVFGALWAGAELHLVPRELNFLPHRLAGFIRAARLTQWCSVPAVLNLMANFDVLRQDDFPDLKRVLFAGDVLPTPTLRHWMARVPHAAYTNLYGPTETTIASSYFTLPRGPDSDREPIPIGTACAGEELLLRDEAMKPVEKRGVVGELYIRGAGVTAGYWRDANKTRNAFVTLDGDARPAYRTGDRAYRGAGGLYYFVGRADAQVKVRGYRIELGDVEAAVNALPDVRECAVVAIESGGFEGAMICCAWASVGGGVPLAQLRRELAEQLPGYMIPVRWAGYELLPKNASGKIDRRRIRETFLQSENSSGAGPDQHRTATAGQLRGTAS